MMWLIAHIIDYPSQSSPSSSHSSAQSPHCQIFSFCLFLLRTFLFCFFEGPGHFLSSDDEAILLLGIIFRYLFVWTCFVFFQFQQFSYSICSTDSLNTALSTSSNITKFGRCFKTWCLFKGYTPLHQKLDSKFSLLNLLISLDKTEGNSVSYPWQSHAANHFQAYFL